MILVAPSVFWGCVLLVKVRSLRAAWRRSQRLSAAAARALAALDAKRASYDGEHVAQVLIAYLGQRFKLVPVEPTPAEVEQCLLTYAVAPAQRMAVAELLHECAAARFSPPGDKAIRNVREWAEQVIRALDMAT
jgi:HEAT repeat protein